MASAVPCCSLCEHLHISILAEVWCPECEEALCENCYQHHSVSKISKKHETIPISEYVKLPSSVHAIKQFCENHGEKFVTYCKVHECPCCVKCTIGNHSTCKDIVSLDEVIHNAKTSNAFTEIEHVLDELALNLKKIKTHKNKNIQELVTEKMKIKTEIENMKKSIVQHLDKLGEAIIKNLNDAEEEQIIKINQSVDMLSEKERNIVNNQEMLRKVKDHASNLQAFLVTKQMVGEVEKCEKFLTSLVESNNLKTKHLSFNFATNVSDFLSKVQDLGHIYVEDSPCEIGLTRKKEKQAQLLSPFTTPTSIDDITFQLKNQISTNGRNISGLTVLTNGKLLYADSSVVCISNDGTIEWKREMSNKIFDIELIEDSKVAVSCGGNFSLTVSLIDLETRIITKTYDLPSWVYGISAMNDKLVCSCRNKDIQVIDLQRGSLTRIYSPTGAISSNSYIKSCSGNIYYTDSRKNIVVCCDMNGKKIWEFKDKPILRCPSGIDVDVNGFVYVVGEKTCNLVVFSPDGRQCRQLLSKNDGLQNPKVLFYNKTEGEIFIANEWKTIFRYSIRL